MIVQYTNESSDNAISYTWTFEGGEPATSTEQNPQVTYAFPGVYTVTLIATNGAGSDALTRFDYIRVGGEPVAEFGFTQDGFTVEFINVSTAADNFIWNFGDGGMSTDENPIYTFEPGLSYPVQLIVINECGTDTTEQVINFEGEAPEPFISADQTMGCTPFTVAFADMSAGEPTEWFWQFEGGEPATSTEENPTVTYNDAGTFEVSLQVSNVFGTMSQVFASYITVNSMPEAEFDFNTEGLEVSFEDLSTGGNITHNWAFGDGNESQDKNPVHLYESPGLYEVQLAIKNDCGADTFSVEINLIIDDVAEVSWLEGIALFPNPNNGNFTVELRGLPAEALEFRIFNVLGQQFYQASDNFSAGFLRKNFEVEYLTAGLYLLEIRSGNAGYYRKIVIE